VLRRRHGVRYYSVIASAAALQDRERARGCDAVVATDVGGGKYRDEVDRKYCQKLRPFNPSSSQWQSI